MAGGRVKGLKKIGRLHSMVLGCQTQAFCEVMRKPPPHRHGLLFERAFVNVFRHISHLLRV